MDFNTGVPPEEILLQLSALNEQEFIAGMMEKSLGVQRAKLLFDIVQGNFYVASPEKIDLLRFALKALLPEDYRALELANHLWSHSDLFKYDPPKNGQNIMKHGLAFAEVHSYAHLFGRLTVQCPFPDGVTRSVVFSNLDTGTDGGNLCCPLPKVQGMISVMSIGQFENECFKFISARRLGRTNYIKVMSDAFKNVHMDNPSAKEEFVNGCAEIVKADLFSALPEVSP
ncbi:hypothetical protein CSQ91_09785 [Janthinobacterium sp. BJB301]|uniref:hypothetical protein n=1 Tax=Janthinobacterium sp. BJB301 TaxID=1560195 RepID=UPI000C0CD33D|nr:hypothetical protein [Janthinobacterium sp. BJB301]PHV51371.1 hypothetical protein CSQ91_09785 [Janthinobacterium sp. BJB301]